MSSLGISFEKILAINLMHLSAPDIDQQ
jgi:hypothetical protein